eukprot:jgi/Botrbrau1/4259/Bobra.0044s0052.2
MSTSDLSRSSNQAQAMSSGGTENTELREAVERIASQISPCTDSEARDFFGRFPLEALFRNLHGCVDDHYASSVTMALDALFSTAYGQSVLATATPYAIAALGSSATPLRRLGCRQLGRFLQVTPTEHDGAAVSALLGALEDIDTGVAAEAEKGLLAYGRSDAGCRALLSGELKDQLQSLAETRDPVVRMRVFSLVVKLACSSMGHALAIEDSGLLKALLEELRTGDDVLARMSALELVAELADEAPSASRAAVAASSMPILISICSCGDPPLEVQALRVAAAVLRASKEPCEDNMEVDAPYANGHITDPLLKELKNILDIRGTREVSRELEEAALDAVGELGSSAAGATLLLEDPSNILPDVAEIALGRAGDRERRVTALHALGSVGGVERSRGVRRAALLSPEAEDFFQAAVYAPINSAAVYRTLPEVLLAFVTEPWPELRVAMYRFLVALSLRSWGASEICQYAGLLSRILDPASEVGRELSEWRYATVQALAATAAQQQSRDQNGGFVRTLMQVDAVDAAVADIERSVRLGIYGSGTGGILPDISTRTG